MTFIAQISLFDGIPKFAAVINDDDIIRHAEIYIIVIIMISYSSAHVIRAIVFIHDIALIINSVFVIFMTENFARENA